MSLIDAMQQSTNTPLLNMDAGLVPRPSTKGISQADFEFISALLRDLSRWMNAKNGPATGSQENAQSPANPDQIWRGDLTPRNFSDPMGDFIAKIGEA